MSFSFPPRFGWIHICLQPSAASCKVAGCTCAGQRRHAFHCQGERTAAIAVWARLARDDDLIRWATEIKRRAERKTAELLRDIAKGGDEQRQQRARSRREIEAEGLAALRWPEELAERRFQRSA